MNVPRSRVTGNQAVHQAAMRHRQQPTQSRIISPPIAAISVGPYLALPVTAMVETQSSEHLYHPVSKHHDAVAAGTELFVIVVFVFAAGKLVHRLVLGPFETQERNGVAPRE